MWKDFNIDEYAPSRSLKERPASASGSYNSNKENYGWSSTRPKPAETWSPIITIPKPFNMMKREEKKQKKKTKVSGYRMVFADVSVDVVGLCGCIKWLVFADVSVDVAGLWFFLSLLV